MGDAPHLRDITEGEAIAEARALVEPYIVGTKHVRIRVVTLRRILAALAAASNQPAGQPRRDEPSLRPPSSAEARMDEYYAEAVALVTRDQKPSTSYVQRKLQLNYNTANALMERMEREGLVTPTIAGRREMIAQNSRKDGSSLQTNPTPESKSPGAGEGRVVELEQGLADLLTTAEDYLTPNTGVTTQAFSDAIERADKLLPPNATSESWNRRAAAVRALRNEPPPPAQPLTDEGEGR